MLLINRHVKNKCYIFAVYITYMEYFYRYKYEELKLHLTRKQVTVLTGMRRTGKTTLVRQLMAESDIQQKVFYDLERIDNRKFFERDNYEHIIQDLTQQGFDFSQKVLICIDEIQMVPNITSVIKYLYDHYDIKFIVTGSSSYYIKNKFQESLSGRKKIFEIFPLTFGEMLTFNDVEHKSIKGILDLKNSTAEKQRLDTYYQQYIEYGGFPQVVLAKTEDEKKDILQDIISSYLNIDIQQLAEIRKLKEVYKVIELMASRIGNKLDIAKFSLTTGLARQTIENYIYLLEQSYLLKTLPVFTFNKDKEIVKSRKVYFYDNGLANILADLSSGVKFENAIFSQLHHFGDLSYYQLKSGLEIDFIVDQKYGFEVKETAYESDAKTLHRLGTNIELKYTRVLGKSAPVLFEDYVWGGMVK